MSSTGPGEGTLRVNPILKQATAYALLKPFFDSQNRLNLDSAFPGSVPGACQEYNPTWHPDLELKKRDHDLGAACRTRRLRGMAL